jgi:TRAP-type C4-dicarboxylate transport system permease small subunit
MNLLMQIFEALVVKVSRWLDLIAGLILSATAVLVVANILGRALLQRSILGTYEMVGFLTAAVVGLALARCAVENCHIAVGFIMERFPERLQRIVDIAVGLPVFFFLCFTTYNLVVYGARISATGEVAPTTQLIFYPFIYVVAIGFFVLALTVLLRMLKQLSGGEQK